MSPAALDAGGLSRGWAAAAPGVGVVLGVGGGRGEVVSGRGGKGEWTGRKGRVGGEKKGEWGFWEGAGRKKKGRSGSMSEGEGQPVKF